MAKVAEIGVNRQGTGVSERYWGERYGAYRMKEQTSFWTTQPLQVPNLWGWLNPMLMLYIMYAGLNVRKADRV